MEPAWENDMTRMDTITLDLLKACQHLVRWHDQLSPADVAMAQRAIDAASTALETRERSTPIDEQPLQMPAAYDHIAFGKHQTGWIRVVKGSSVVITTSDGFDAPTSHEDWLICVYPAVDWEGEEDIGSFSSDGMDSFERALDQAEKIAAGDE